MNIAIILSGGIGSRMGSQIPKQYIEINGKPIIIHTIEKFINNPLIDAIIIAIAPEWKEYMLTYLEKFKLTQPIYYSLPGETRQFTIFNALKVALEHYSENDIVIVHDAARPLVSTELINACLTECITNDGVLPVIPVKDTIYQSYDKSTISSLLPRETLYAGQAPEAFNLGKYLQAHQTISKSELLKINGSTEIAYKNNMQIKLISGEDANFKITTPEDLERFKQIKSKNIQ